MLRKLEEKIKSPVALKRTLNAKRTKGAVRLRRVVFTNGCFDLLHQGHVRYLQSARRLGDCLVVALNTDESVRALKGPSRPINSLAQRLEVIAALEAVDFVTWFGDATPLKLIEDLRPGVLVKGGDWKVSEIVGAPQVLSWGGKVKSLPYLEDRSTTLMIQRAQLR